MPSDTLLKNQYFDRLVVNKLQVNELQSKKILTMGETKTHKQLIFYSINNNNVNRTLALTLLL